MSFKPKSFKLATTLVVGGLAVALSWALLSAPKYEPPPLPEPNGYDDFVRAGKMLIVDLREHQDAPLEERRALTASNAPALQRLREGLTKECRVPIEFTAGDSTTWSAHMGSFKTLALALRAESDLALETGDPGRAAEIGLELIAFGCESGRGGVLIHRMLSDMILRLGSETLAQTIGQLDLETTRRIAREFEKTLLGMEPLDQVRETEIAWIRATYGVHQRVAAVVMTRSLRPVRTVSAPQFARCEQAEAAASRVLLDLAAHAYELEHGRAPETAEDLVPEYLQAVPADPTSGDPMPL